MDPDKGICIALPPDPKLAGQLGALQYKLNAKGKIQLESKQEMKKRGLPSPDRADALALTMMQFEGGMALPSQIDGEPLSDFYDLGLWKESDYVHWHEYYH